MSNIINRNKLYIVSIHYNSTDFLEIQHKSIHKYIDNDNFEYIVFNDANNILDYSNFNTDFKQKIKDKCKELNIKCVRIPQEIHKNRNLIFKKKWSETRKLMNESIYENSQKKFDGYNSNINNTIGARHCDSMQFVTNYFLNISDCKYLFNLDADMFFIDKMNLNDFMKDSNISYIPQSRENINYMWPNIFIIDYELCPNLKDLCWDGCCIFKDGKFINKGTDTGGETFEYLKQHNNILNKRYITFKMLLNYENYENYIKSEEYIALSNEKLNIFLLDNIKLNNSDLNAKKSSDKSEGPNKELFMNDSVIHLRGSGSNWTNRSKMYYDELLRILKNYYE